MTNSPHSHAYVSHGNPAMSPSSRRISKWWPISLFITAVVFIIIGGALVGSWASSTNYYDYNDGLLYGGAACFAIGGLCKLTAWILLIVWCVQGRHPQATAPNVNYTSPYAIPAAQPGYVSMPPHSTTPVMSYPHMKGSPNAQASGMRYCGNCGVSLTSAFCTQCGVKG